jgi:hypothetical protein
MAQRNGIPTLIDVAHELCRLITKFTPVITTQFPTNDDLMTALALANAACAVLEVEARNVRIIGD